MTQLKIKDLPVLDDPELIIFDKDGTLIDVHFYWTAMIRLRADKIVQKYFPGRSDAESIWLDLVETMGINHNTGRMKREGPVGIRPRSYIIQVVVEALCRTSNPVPAKEIEQIFNEVDQNTLGRILDFVKILPGVADFLKQAHAAGVKLAIATSDRTDRAEETFREMGLLNYFDSVLGGDRIQRSKPEPEMVNRLISELGVKREKTVVVGDHPVDILMGQNAGLTCNVGVLTGLGRTEDFLSMPCILADDFSQMRVDA